MSEYVCDLTGDYPGIEFGDEEYSGTCERRERVVRCRDCKHGDPFCDSSSYAGMIDCMHFSQWDYYNDKPGIWPVEPDGFCAWGERRGA